MLKVLVKGATVHPFEMQIEWIKIHEGLNRKALTVSSNENAT